MEVDFPPFCLYCIELSFFYTGNFGLRKGFSSRIKEMEDWQSQSAERDTRQIEHQTAFIPRLLPFFVGRVIAIDSFPSLYL